MLVNYSYYSYCLQTWPPKPNPTPITLVAVPPHSVSSENWTEFIPVTARAPHEWCNLIGRWGMTIHKEQVRHSTSINPIQLTSLTGQPTQVIWEQITMETSQGDSLSNHPNSSQQEQDRWKHMADGCGTKWNQRWLTNRKPNKTIQLNSNWGLGDQVGLQDLKHCNFSSFT